MKITVALLLLLLIFPFSYSQTPAELQAQTQALFDSLHGSLDKLTRKFGNKSKSSGIEADIRQSLSSITDNAKFLESIVTSVKPIPKEYLESLTLDEKLLRKLSEQGSKSQREKRELYAGLKEVDSDLTIKVAHIKRSRGGEAKVVQVFVHAKKGDQEVAAYEVWYVLRGWADDSSRFKRFDGLTNPSSPPNMNLAPGNYFIWLSKGQPVTSRQPVSIGGDGKDRREIEVSVP